MAKLNISDYLVATKIELKIKNPVNQLITGFFVELEVFEPYIFYHKLKYVSVLFVSILTIFVYMNITSFYN